MLGRVPCTWSQTAFSDNFGDPAFTAANWSTDAGHWRAKGNVYDLNDHQTPDNFSTVSSLTNFTDFTLNCDLLSSQEGGLIFRTNPATLTGVALIASPVTGTFYFTVRKGTSFSDILSTTALNVPAGTDLHLTLTALGNNFTAVVSLASDPAVPLSTVSLNGSDRVVNLTSGRVGVYENGRDAFERFDNFSIVVPEPSTWALCIAGMTGVGMLAARRMRVSEVGK